MNKPLHSQIVLSEEIVELLPGGAPPPGFVGLKGQKVEGSETPANIYYLPLENSENLK